MDMLKTLSGIIKELGLNNTTATYDNRAGTASVSGTRNGMRITATVSRDGDLDDHNKKYATIGRSAAIEQVKELRKQGHTQVDIADMLGISQSTVSNYLRK